MPNPPGRRALAVRSLALVLASAPSLPCLAAANTDAQGAGLGGHEIRDAETGEVHATVSSIGDAVAIMPGTYDVTFSGSLWPGVRVDAGQTVELRPGGPKLEGATINGHAVRDARGTEIGEVSSLMSSMPLPPGSYSVETATGTQRFDVLEGQWVTLRAKK